MEQSKHQPTFWQLQPFFLFIGVFTGLHTWFHHAPASSKSGFAIFACLVALIFSLLTFPKKKTLSEKIGVFLEGSSHPTILYMTFIFIFSSIFSFILAKSGGVPAAVDLGVWLIPPRFILSGLFITVSLFALTIGSSMGTIASFMPIALGFSKTLGIDPALISATVIGGAMLGDNLSIISDTTIAAAKTTGARMTDKFKANALLVLPAALITIAMLFFTKTNYVALYFDQTFSLIKLISILPYIIVFGLALAGVDVLAVLVVGIITAAILGLTQGSFSFLEVTSFLFEGFYSQQGMVNVLILVLLIAGLAKIIEHNGGIDYILNKWHPRIKSRRSAEFSIALLAFFINAAIAINTVAILITGPVAKKIGGKFKIPAKRIASILDIFACVCQGLLPYTPQLLLASAMAGISSISVMPYLYYQFAIAGVTLGSIWWRKN